MYKTLHHIKLIGETFWREVVDRQARRGAYEMTRATDNGLVEIRPAAGSYVQLDFRPPAEYSGELADYEGRAWLVGGNLAALIGADDTGLLTFEEGETEKTISLEGGYIPVGGHKVYILINRAGSGGSKMNYQFNYGAIDSMHTYGPTHSMMASAPTGVYYRTETVAYNFTTDRDRTLKSITISRTASQVQDGSVMRLVYPKLPISAPIVYIPFNEDLYPCDPFRVTGCKEIAWTGDDASRRVKVEDNHSWWIVMEADADGNYPRCTAQVMGNLEIRLSDTWKKIQELVSGKVDKVTGKGLSTNDYTTAEKTKLAGVEAGANAYTLPNASSTTVGGVKVHADTVVGQNGSPLQTAVNSGRLYALAPYADVDMAGLFMPGEGFEQVYVGLDGQEAQKVDGQFDVAKMGGATASAAGKAGMVPQPAAGDQMKYLRGDGAWDDIRPALLSPYPVKASALDSMNMLATGAQAGASDAAVGVPPYQLRLKITAASASTAVITVKNYVESIMGGAGTTYTVDLTKANGGQAVNQNTIVDIWDGLRMTIGTTEAYLSEAIMQKDSYIVVTCDVGEVGMYYRQGLTNALTALENRIAALENA